MQETVKYSNTVYFHMTFVQLLTGHKLYFKDKFINN